MNMHKNLEACELLFFFFFCCCCFTKLNYIRKQLHNCGSWKNLNFKYNFLEKFSGAERYVIKVKKNINLNI